MRETKDATQAAARLMEDKTLQPAKECSSQPVSPNSRQPQNTDQQPIAEPPPESGMLVQEPENPEYPEADSPEPAETRGLERPGGGHAAQQWPPHESSCSEAGSPDQSTREGVGSDAPAASDSIAEDAWDGDDFVHVTRKSGRWKKGLPEERQIDDRLLDSRTLKSQEAERPTGSSGGVGTAQMAQHAFKRRREERWGPHRCLDILHRIGGRLVA
jgi:hypothetical protein